MHGATRITTRLGTLGIGWAGGILAAAVLAPAALAAAPVAVSDTIITDEDTVATGNVLANDSDADGDTLTRAGNGTIPAAAGTLTIAANGNFTYTPAANWSGTASTWYTVSDGGASRMAYVYITVNPVNDAPVAVADSGEVAQGSGPADYDVLANDTDVEGDSLTLVDVEVAAAQGGASIAGGQVRFAPALAFAGEATITYTVSDGELTADGVLTVTVTPETEPPLVATPGVSFGTGRVNESAPLKVTWSAVDAISGVAGYEVEVNQGGTGFVPFYSGSLTSKTALYPFGTSLQWRVRATDVAGNVSEWSASGTRRLVANQGGAPTVRTGTWTRVETTSASGTTYRYATVKGAKATYAFTGYEVAYVAVKNAKSGYAKVYVDGALAGRFNEYRSSTQYGVIIAKASWRSSGTHRITIVNDQGGKRTNLDAFVVLQ